MYRRGFVIALKKGAFEISKNLFGKSAPPFLMRCLILYKSVSAVVDGFFLFFPDTKSFAQSKARFFSNTLIHPSPPSMPDNPSFSTIIQPFFTIIHSSSRCVITEQKHRLLFVRNAPWQTIASLIVVNPAWTSVSARDTEAVKRGRKKQARKEKKRKHCCLSEGFFYCCALDL
jgi:hypothetical protein